MKQQSEPTPAKMIEAEMEKSGVGREAAIQMILKAFEATLRADGPDEASIKRKLGELFIQSGKERAGWLTEYSAAAYRKKLPGWIRINDEALERGQDPVTVMSVKDGVTMGLAKDRIALVGASKQGKSIDEIVELSYEMDAKKSTEELYAEFLANFGDK